MECKVLDITINSAKGLQDVNLFFKMEVYAVVSIQDYNITRDNTCMQITPIDKDRGRNPEWNSPMKFFVNTFASQLSRLTLVVELKADKKFGNKDIGEVQVPIKELLDSFVESNNERSVSYSIITPSGEAQGLLYFTYKFY
ncbi:protein SRC2 homolog [Castanea sativa]|uniref:protein SRC2 homolog n=1 Tax=Castanea sativa TaxID=21020 RepID=UPI003F651F61